MTDQAPHPSDETKPSESPTGETLEDFLNWLAKQPPTGRTIEEIEAQIREERDSWGD